MEKGLRLTLDHIFSSLFELSPEVILSIGILLIVVVGLVKKDHAITTLLTLLIFSFSFLFVLSDLDALQQPLSLFNGMKRKNKI